MAIEILDSETVEVAEPMVSAFCSELRSKKYFMIDGLATEADQYLDGSSHCWCYLTQQVIGPDGDRAKPNRCTPERSCYRSAL